jgi:hypothetical protein
MLHYVAPLLVLPTNLDFYISPFPCKNAAGVLGVYPWIEAGLSRRLRGLERLADICYQAAPNSKSPVAYRALSRSDELQM